VATTVKIAVIVQSEKFLASAGVQIRYLRFKAMLSEADEAELVFLTLHALEAERQYTADVYLFVKTFTADALTLMAHLSGLRKVVGQDLFDDYFSQFGDARLARFRTWLGRSAPFTDFAVCTTSRMSEVVRSYLPDVPITPVDDPMHHLDRDALDRRLAAKLLRMRRERRVRLIWFGIGDNPYFPVGLQDFIANAEAVTDLQKAGWAVDVTVLTNDRALTSLTLPRLAKLPATIDLTTWSVAVERKALEEADAVLLPVSGQSFSRAKSLNRAITAIENGCQVISQGFPLYRRLDPLIYTDVGQFALDLTRGALRVSALTLNEQADRLRTLGDPRTLTVSFLSACRQAFKGKKQATSAAPGLLCVLHGMESPVAQHKLVSRLGGLSVKTPFHDARWNYHLRFDVEGGQLVVLIEGGQVGRLAAGIQVDQRPRIVHERTFLEVLLPDAASASEVPIHCIASPHLAARLAVYPALMRHAERVVRHLFPQPRVLVSERNVASFATQPWQQPPPAICRSRTPADHPAISTS